MVNGLKVTLSRLWTFAGNRGNTYGNRVYYKTKTWRDPLTLLLTPIKAWDNPRCFYS